MLAIKVIKEVGFKDGIQATISIGHAECLCSHSLRCLYLEENSPKTLRIRNRKCFACVVRATTVYVRTCPVLLLILSTGSLNLN